MADSVKPKVRRAPQFASLLDLSPSRSAPVLLELAARQAARRRPADLLEQYTRDGFVAPSVLDQRTALRLDALALDAASEFEAILLSPVAPLGSCSVVAPSSQDRTLSTTRGTEVVSDPTNVLALECARRLRERPSESVRLCTVHQVLRAQALPPEPGFSRHFRLFALAEAGRRQPEDGFEVDALVRHVRVFDRLFDACTDLGLSFCGRRATVFAAPTEQVLAARVYRGLTDALAHVEVVQAELDSPYYDGLRVVFGAERPGGGFVPIADTGRFDWVARITSNRRFRFVASGLGIQLAPLLFG